MLEWYQLGGDVSDQQWRDISAVLNVQATRLDRAYLSRRAAVPGIAALLRRALVEAGLAPEAAEGQRNQ
jgi:hypothetical protein